MLVVHAALPYIFYNKESFCLFWISPFLPCMPVFCLNNLPTRRSPQGFIFKTLWQGLNFRWDLLKFKISVEKNHKSGSLLPWKIFGFPEFFAFMKRNSLFAKKFTNFRVTLASFVVSVVISYCQSKVIVYQFYQEWNAISSKNSVLHWKILHILLVFNEIIVYLCKMIKNLKNINCGKSSYSGNFLQES